MASNDKATRDIFLPNNKGRLGIKQGNKGRLSTRQQETTWHQTRQQQGTSWHKQGHLSWQQGTSRDIFLGNKGHQGTSFLATTTRQQGNPSDPTTSHFSYIKRFSEHFSPPRHREIFVMLLSHPHRNDPPSPLVTLARPSDNSRAVFRHSQGRSKTCFRITNGWDARSDGTLRMHFPTQNGPIDNAVHFVSQDKRVGKKVPFRKAILATLSGLPSILAPRGIERYL